MATINDDVKDLSIVPTADDPPAETVSPNVVYLGTLEQIYCLSII
jgi:hypothetical protein